MSLPGRYTEKTLAEFMHETLGPVAQALELCVGQADAGSYAEAVNETLLGYGVAAPDLALDNKKLRALARRSAWQLAVSQLAGLFDFSDSGSTFHRAEMFAQAEHNLQAAHSACLVYDEAYQVLVTRQQWLDDPYRYLAQDERGL